MDTDNLAELVDGHELDIGNVYDGNVTIQIQGWCVGIRSCSCRP